MEQAQVSAKPKKKKKKGWIAVVIIVVLLAGIGGGIAACSAALSKSLEQMGAGLLETSTAEKRDILDSISVSGQVESENMVKITSTLTAKVKSIYVEVGSEVHEGDLLCEFDDTDLRQQYDQLVKSQENAEGMSANSHRINERNLENAKTEKANTLAQAQRAIDEAIKARDKAYAKEKDLVDQYNNNLARKGDLQNQLAAAADPAAYTAISEQLGNVEMTLQTLDQTLESLRDSFETYDNAVQNAQDAYASAERSADAMIQSYQDVLDNEQYSNDSSATQNEIDKLKDMIDQCTVRAPKDGIITSLNIAEGSLPTVEALMTIENTDALKITVSIAEADILKVHEGMKATVRTTATGDEEFSATVSRVVNIYKAGTTSLMGQETGGGYSAEITIDDANTDLLIGMNAKVQIIMSEKKDVLSVPYESIITNDDGTYSVLLAVQQEDGTFRAKAAKVEPGMEGTYYTEITSSEVKEGDKVVTTPGDYKDGDVLPIFDFGSALNAQNGGAADEGGADE